MGRNTIHVTDNQGGNGWMALYTFFFCWNQGTKYHLDRQHFEIESALCRAADDCASSVD